MIDIYTLLEWCITSSVLILLIIGLRQLTKQHLSPVLRYSLWLVVLLRLLIPYNPLHSILSIMNVAEPIIDSSEAIRSAIDITYHEKAGFFTDSNNILNYQAQVTSWRYLIYGIWGYGMFIAAESILANNWRLYRKLKLMRKPLQDHTDPTRPRLYGMEGLASPCLFGIFRPSIYLNGVSLSDPEIQRHALAHERAHYRHGDHIWSVLRLLALILHWYNPLVWWACFLSKQDGEAAADDLAIRTLGEESRLAYGQTLIQLVAQRKISFSIFSCSTTMVSSMISSKRALRKRILTLAQAPHTARLTFGIVGVMLLTSILLTFTGAQASDWFDLEPPAKKSYVSTKPAIPICTDLRDHLFAWCNSYTYTDVSSQFPELAGYDKSYFNDFCMYRFEDGSLIGAAEIKKTKAGDISSPIVVDLQEYAAELQLDCRFGHSSYELNFAIYADRDSTLTVILNNILNAI